LPCCQRLLHFTSLGEADELRPLKTLRFPNSLGWFFSRVTQLLGLRPRRDEHKVQWLSKDGQPYFVPALRKVFHWNADGLPVLNKRYLGSGAQEDAVFSETILR
jgi:carbamoyltransferase